MIENEQTTSTSEIDTNAGWKLTHYTKTWDVRERLDTIAPILEDKRAQLERLKAEVDELENQKAQVDALPDSVKAALFPNQMIDVVTEATSTPIK